MRQGIDLPTRRLVSQDDAAITQRADIPRSRFTGTWTRKTSFDAGYLIPIMIDEILPGDHMTYDITAYVRLSTPLFPILDNQRIDTFFFFIPMRLIWPNWAKFMGEQTNPGDSINYTVPTIESPVSGYGPNTIFDHMGLPVQGMLDVAETIVTNGLPLRAYNLVYNQWFRDENLASSLVVEIDDGPDDPNNYALQRRAKSHDYFTSALPWPQKFTAPNIPVAGQAPITGLGTGGRTGAVNVNVYETATAGSPVNYAFYREAWDVADELYVKMSAAADGNPQIFADLSQATGVAINTFRQAFLVQQLMERDARGGTRYVELIKSHFGVTNPDFRLQRPEYIGGGQTPLVITPVAQTAPGDSSVVGALGAAGTAAGSHRASYAATEHGYILGLINVRSELSYQQGLHKLWSRSTRYDFYWPSLAGLGEQAILRKEIYVTGVAADDDVFGYQERWHEYRTHVSEITGLMRSSDTATLDYWHLAQRFLAAPTLNQTFIQDTPPMARVLAAGAEALDQQYLADILFTRTAVRPIPTFGTPVLLGRF